MGKSPDARANHPAGAGRSPGEDSGPRSLPAFCPARARQALSAMVNRERRLARMLAAVRAGQRVGEYVDFDPMAEQE